MKEADVAALKFCYVDIAPGTNIKKLFIEYTMSTEKLKKKYPGMIIIHFTNPLTTLQTGIKAWIMKLIRRPLWGVEENMKRNQYNQLLLGKYQGKEPVFDIVKIQSTFPDGSRSTFTRDGQTYFSMVPEYTSDGGHLNELGRKKIAEQFLILLARLT
ncbi:hypothetical protein ACFL2E_07855 [Thermodesulfobacteriota bacterium]